VLFGSSGAPVCPDSRSVVVWQIPAVLAMPCRRWVRVLAVISLVPTTGHLCVITTQVVVPAVPGDVAHP